MLKTLDYLMGEVCKTILPIPEEIYLGNQNSSIAICTLSSIDLLKKISNSNILDNVAIIGRLLSENKGIDEVIHYVNSNSNIKTIVLCGKEVSGHKAGHSLLELHKNGINKNKKIINSTSPDPILTASESEVKKFQSQSSIIDLIGETNSSVIKKLIISIKN